MPNSEWLMLMDAVNDSGAFLLFSAVVLAGYGVLLLAILFSSLAVRSAWRWLRVHSWRHAILLAERRALR